MLHYDNDDGHLKPVPLNELRYENLPPDLPQQLLFSHPAFARGYWQRLKDQADGFQDGWFSAAASYCATMVG